MIKNPFKFGSIVEEPYFTNRKEEIKKITSILSSANHLIVISPRRYGKTSLLNKAVQLLDRPFISLDLQLVTTPEDFAAQLLKRVYRVYPFEKIKQLIKHFRIIPTLTINALTNETDVLFKPTSSYLFPFEDVFDLIEKLGSPKKKPIVLLDEFQEIKRIGKNLEKHLRSILQYHNNVNYVFLGSQESLIREIFEKNKSPFYHFGILFSLGKIPRNEFQTYLSKRFNQITNDGRKLANAILDITQSHPHYTQQLAFTVWELLKDDKAVVSHLETAVSEIVQHHDVDYERLWNTLNRIDMKILIGMAFSQISPLSKDFARQFDTGAGSTVFSSIKRLMQSGLVAKGEKRYEIDNPFFKKWIQVRRLK